VTRVRFSNADSLGPAVREMIVSAVEQAAIDAHQHLQPSVAGQVPVASLVGGTVSPDQLVGGTVSPDQLVGGTVKSGQLVAAVVSFSRRNAV
jgi:hypothetical protein